MLLFNNLQIIINRFNLFDDEIIMEEEFDLEQKCTLFKHISMLKLHLLYPRFQIPRYLIDLRRTLKDQLDQLQEFSIICLVEAYEHLPPEFPTDLLDEIKSMVMATLEHMPQTLRDLFL